MSKNIKDILIKHNNEMKEIRNKGEKVKQLFDFKESKNIIERWIKQ